MSILRDRFVRGMRAQMGGHECYANICATTAIRELYHTLSEDGPSALAKLLKAACKELKLDIAE